ncbi:MAG: Rrf2 family transcriptional regulator [Dehalococcoidia bacterium]|nr:Rrf2 family transcriptional regulator [Dehalococcoidia bacterium]MDO8635523.1 Rrf2 family transcriptional regulator [Dehalococcoidia bacterium]
MKLSVKVDYGVRVLVDLAQRYGQGSVHSSDIAARQGIPEPYLDQLLMALRKAGFINSKRGPQGGHILAKAPLEINLGEVITALEGSTAPECVQEPAGCERATICVQRDVWRAIEEATTKLLQATTIGELVQQQERRLEGAMFYI